MIDIIDPNLNLPQPAATPSVEPVERIKPETVSIQEEKLDSQRDRRLVEEQHERQRRQKDKLEISQLEGGEATDEEDNASQKDRQENNEEDDGSIDILI